MAYISRKNKLLFIHIYKTGGMSVRKAMKQLDPNCYELGVGHSDAKEVYEHFKAFDNLKYYDKLHKFAVVRNPYHWLDSIYHFAFYYKTHPLHHKARTRGSNEFIEWYIRNHDYMNDDKERFNFNGNIQTQTMFLYEGEKLMVDSVLRFENLEQDFKRMLESLSIKYEDEFPMENINPYPLRDRNYSNMLTASTLKYINKFYDKDFKNFQYEKYNHDTTTDALSGTTL